MSIVAQRVFVLGGNTTYMTLANEEFVRPLSISNNWTKLRLGLLMAVTPDGTNNLSTVLFSLGICSGQANPNGSSNTTNWVGAFINSGGSLTYTANSGNPYFGCQLTNFGKRVVNTNTLSAPGGAGTLGTNTGTIQRRTPWYVDITKGSPNYTFQSFASSNLSVDYPFYSFLDGMEQASGATINGVAFNASNSTTVAVSEGPGIFDTFDVLWNKSQFPLEIYAMAVYRQA